MSVVRFLCEQIFDHLITAHPFPTPINRGECPVIEMGVGDSSPLKAINPINGEMRSIFRPHLLTQIWTLYALGYCIRFVITFVPLPTMCVAVWTPETKCLEQMQGEKVGQVDVGLVNIALPLRQYSHLVGVEGPTVHDAGGVDQGPGGGQFRGKLGCCVKILVEGG